MYFYYVYRDDTGYSIVIGKGHGFSGEFSRYTQPRIKYGEFVKEAERKRIAEEKNPDLSRSSSYGKLYNLSKLLRLR